MNWILTSLCAVTLLVTGCGKSGQTSQVDPAPVEKSFASADPSVKDTAQKAVALVKQGNYQEAVVELQKLGGNAKLTDAQKKAVSDVLAKVQKAVAEKMKQAAAEANKALGDAQKALGK